MFFRLSKQKRLFKEWNLNQNFILWNKWKQELWPPPWWTCIASGGSSCSVLSCVRLFATPQTVAQWTPLSIGASREEYWSGLPWSPPGDLLLPRDRTTSLALAGAFFTIEPPGKPREHQYPWSSPAPCCRCTWTEAHRREPSVQNWNLHGQYLEVFLTTVLPPLPPLILSLTWSGAWCSRWIGPGD